MKKKLLDISAIIIKQLPVHLEYVGDLLNYEGPLMSVYVDDNGNPYIYSWVESSDLHNRWLVYQTTNNLLSEYIFGELKDVKLLNRPVNDIIFIVDNLSDWTIENCFVISPKNLPYEYLPDHTIGFDNEEAVNLSGIIDAFDLSKESFKRSSEAVFDILKEAEKSRHEIVNIHIHNKEGEVGYGRIRSSILGEVLSNFTKMTRATAKNIFDTRANSNQIERTRRKKGEMQHIIDLSEYEFVRADAASFSVILKPIIAQKDLFSGETVAEKINNQLFELFRASSDVDQLKEASENLSQEMLTAYNSFLNEIKERDINLDLNYGNPLSQLKLNENFNAKKAIRIIDNLKSIDFADSEEVKTKGVFKALDAIKCTFKFVDLRDDIYMGKFSDQLKDGVFQFNLKDLYEVTLEIKRTKKSGKKDIKEDIVLVACVEESSS